MYTEIINDYKIEIDYDQNFSERFYYYKKDDDSPEPQMYLFGVKMGIKHQYEAWKDLIAELLGHYFTKSEAVNHFRELKEITIPQAVEFLRTKIEIEFVSVLSHDHNALLLGYYRGLDVSPVGVIFQDKKNADKIRHTVDWRKEAISQIKDTFSYYRNIFENKIWRYTITGQKEYTCGGYIGDEGLKAALDNARDYVRECIKKEEEREFSETDYEHYMK